MNRVSVLRYLFAIAKLIDVMGNVLIIGFFKMFFALPPACGNAHYTCSEAFAEMRDNGIMAGCVLCKILTWIQNKVFKIAGDHCTSAMSGIPTNIDAA